MYTFCTRPYACRLCNSLRHEYITLAPREYPTRVTGRKPKFLAIRESARINPADVARSRDTLHGLSSRYDNLVNTTGSWIDAMSATRIVLPRTCCSDWVRTSVARILIVWPIDFSISGSHKTENRSPMTGSTVENGSLTSSSFPLIHLHYGGQLKIYPTP